jgi:hypothetical protein
VNTSDVRKSENLNAKKSAGARGSSELPTLKGFNGRGIIEQSDGKVQGFLREIKKN